MPLRTSLTVTAVLGLVALAASFLVLGSTADVRPDPPRGPVAAPSADLAPSLSPSPRAAPSPSPSPEPTPSPSPEPVPVSRPRLQERLASLLATPDLALDGARLAVAVRDEHGRVVLDHRAGEPLLPASTLKLVTAASALLTFGPGHRFETLAGVTAPLTGNGTVVGDLVLVGSGDPVLGTPTYERWIYPSRPRTKLEALADAVVAAGVRRITGGVVGDGTAFIGARVASGWPDRYLTQLDARRISGLSVDGGLAYAVDETATPPEVTIELEDDPARLAAAALSRMLVERGVTVERGPRSAPATPAVVEVVGTVASPPLRSILRHMVQRSDNQVADTLLQTVGVARTGTGSWAMGALSARAAIAGLGVDARGIVVSDGSGLSRDDRLSAAFLAELDAAMGASPHAATWSDLMAVAGEEGTLRRRLRGTLAEGRFRGKTGTLDDVKAVVGTVPGPGERRYHLAVVANDARGRDRAVVSVLMDELVLALAEDLYGCVREPLPTPTPTATGPGTAAPTPPPAPTPPYVPPYRLDCPDDAAA